MKFKSFTFLLSIAGLALAGHPAFGDVSVHYGNKSVRIASSFQTHMQCVLDELKKKPYHPKDVGCFGSRPNASAHPTGHACDVDQTGRDLTSLGSYKKRGPFSTQEQISIAKKCHAVSGCSWTRSKNSPDCGHFEAMGKEGYVSAGGGHRYPQYADRHVRRR